MGDAAGDLIEAFFKVRRDGEDVAGIAERHLFPEIDAHLVIVGRIERRDSSNSLGAEAGAGAVGGAAVEGDADDGGIILADILDVLDIGRLQEGVDAGEVGELAAGKGGDRFVGDAVGAGEAHVERPFYLLGPALAGELPFRFDRAPALAVQFFIAGMVMAPLMRQMLGPDPAGRHG